jgi:PAS domain S-box-containing protein
VLFAILAAGIAAAGALSYGASSAALHSERERELAAIAQLKVDEILRWRAERLADADVVAHEIALSDDAFRDEERTRAVLDVSYATRRSIGEYTAVALVDPEARVRYAVGPSAEGLLTRDDMRAAVRRALAARAAELSPVHRHAPDDVLHLNAIAPVIRGGRVQGAVVLRIDPTRTLDRVLESWPGASTTAEVLLVRSEGGRAVLDSPEASVHVQDPPATAVHAGEDVVGRAASGREGVSVGRDQRGREVIAAVKTVPGSPWTLVAKIDRAEALAPLVERRLWAMLAVFGLVLAAGAAALVWWRAQSAAAERQRFRAEAERSALAAKLEHLTRYARDMIFLADEGHRIVEANDRALQLLGYAREELVGTSVVSLRDPATLGDFDGHTKHQIVHGADVFETRYRRKDGTTFPVEVSVHVEMIDGRRWFQGIARDITDRKRAEEALRESEARFRAAFEFASVGVLLVDPGGNIQETNRAFRRILGYEEHEIPATHVSQLSPAANPSAEVILERLRSGEAERIELPRRYRRKDGSFAEVVLRATALRDAGGTVRYVVAVVEDLSEKKGLEAQLLLAARMASVGTLAAGVAHEINNPLAFILANLEFALAQLAAKGGDPDVVRALQEAAAGGARVREIVRDLKTFSRADDDAREPLDVWRVLQSALGVAANELRHRAEVEVDLRPVPRVLASEHRLAQVFLNLLINAAQSIPEGHASQNRVRASTATAEDGRAIVEVSDTGSGIAPDILPRIFDPFFTTKPVGVGTGLGLAICHGIVSALGGEIEVRTQVGAGTTFRVLLPAAPEAQAAPEPPRTAAPPAPGRARVLVVDDEPLVARAVQRVLSAHDVVVCSSARAALSALEAPGHPFDVVFCDLMMPEMTGMDLHARLREVSPETAERMVFLTGGAFTANARAFLDAVPNPRLEKPFEPAALREIVQSRVAPVAANA